MSNKISIIAMCLMIFWGFNRDVYAVVYPDSVTWYLTHNAYNTNATTTKDIVAYGNGYYGKITSKSGNDPYNAVEIECITNSMTPVYISTLNMPVSLSPSGPFDYYVTFKVTLQYNYNGYYSTNVGTIYHD